MRYGLQKIGEQVLYCQRRSYAPIGKTLVIFAVGGTHQKLSMIATTINQGKTRWMIIDEVSNSDKLIEFLEALIKDAGRKVF